jgi:non-lysosomal glucosylceramidase
LNREKRSVFATRRRFLQAAATASLSLPGMAIPSLGESLSPAMADAANGVAPAAAEDQIQFPRVFTGQNLSRISFPLGGIGTGGIGLGGRGNLSDWGIFNRPDPGAFAHFAIPVLWVKSGHQAPRSLVLERRLLPPYDLAPDGLGSDNVPGLPRLAEATFRGSFPIAAIEFHDDTLPVRISLEAFTSFQPLDADLSGLPAALLSYEVRNPGPEAAEVVIGWCVENPLHDLDHIEDGEVESPPSPPDHRKNEQRQGGGIRGILMNDPSLAEDHPLKGSFALAVFEEENGYPGIRPYLRANEWGSAAIQRFWFEDFSLTGELGQQVEPLYPTAAIALRQIVPAGENRKFRFLVAWHFPIRTPARCGWEAPKGKESFVLGNHYCTRFSDAWAVAEYFSQNLAQIEERTRNFVEVMRSSTLPPAVIDGATANLCTLVTNTSFRIADGSFHGFEGSGRAHGWGFGSCTHVWNYEVATQFVFPALAQSMRSTSFGYATDAEGKMDFRHKLPLGEEHWGAAAADGQMGQIVKLYLDWRLSGDNAWLRQLWPACKRALAYAWRPGGWDGDKDGVMEGAQQNTYDVEFYGPNPMCETWYLAALKASAAMAAAMGDSQFATTCQSLYDQGSRWVDAHLFNGEYYIQQVRGIPADQIAKGLRLGNGPNDTLHPDYQVGRGCLLDQLLGQYMADLAGLGPLLKVANMRAALESIYRYNYKRNLTQHESVERVFALNEEAALILCDYPQGGRPAVPMPYDTENFTGSEYAAAVVMVKYGMVQEGVECIRNIRQRYDGRKANPYSEAEWGRHYARAMASWGAVPTLSGFSYSGLTRELEVKPLLQREDFCCFWSTPTAWGSFRQLAQGGILEFQLEPRQGTIALQRLKLDPRQCSCNQATITVGGRRVPHTVERQDGQVLFRLNNEVNVDPSAKLDLAIH